MKRLRYLGLELDFDLPFPVVQAHEPYQYNEAVATAQMSQARDANLKDEVDLRDDQLEQMLIEDPVRYEELLRLRDITDERT